LDANTTASYSVAIGSGALGQSTGEKNVAVGHNALHGVTTGIRNIAIGIDAGNGQTGGNDNVYIGPDCPENAGTSNEVIIWNNSKQARFQGSDTSWSFSSDGRDKTNVEDLTLGLNLISKLKPRKFTWDPRDSKRDAIKGDVRSGFIAQEVLSAVEEVDTERITTIVDTTDSESFLVSESAMVPMLVKAVQELSTKNDELAAEIASLKSQINN
jgi:hypothetical protein